MKSSLVFREEFRVGRAALHHLKGLQLGKVLFALLSAILINVFDPLGLSGATQERSVESLNKILSPFHPTDGQGTVTVVLIDEPSVDPTLGEESRKQGIVGVSYPLTYDNYRDILSVTLSYRPKAVFVDLIISEGGSRAEDGGSLARLLGHNMARREATARGEPVPLPYVPVYYPDPEAVGVPLSRQPACEHGGVAELGVFGALAEERPFIIRDDAFTGFYPLLAQRDCASEDGDNLLVSPALMLYLDLCRDHPETCPHGLGPPDTPLVARFGTPMALGWSDATGPGNLAYRDRQGTPYCQSFESSPAERAGRYFLAALFGAAGDRLVRPPESNCFYQDSLSVLELLSQYHRITPPAFGVGPQNCDALGDGIGSDFLEKRLCGRVVMLGMDLVGINDTMPSPVHGRVPGVVWHAQALDNLLVYGPDYLRQPPTVFMNADMGSAFEIGLLFVALLGAAITARWIKRRRSRPQHAPASASLPAWSELAEQPHLLIQAGVGLAWIAAKLLVVGAVIFCLILGAEIIYVSLSRYEPNNWLGVASIAYATFGFMISRMSGQGDTDGAT
ncbi:CHASE2 domain-containing protein [Roseospirillum parvum]|uniref:CHASE2 domain-containing protein n=1 Tax=Roseospirillum parvum TaxID=83401 RepID=A0A1G7UGB9_9PROT|nr:CHASE2 domain-containing protein [Roseospirillum parvum]SDG46612.1 CHASE2 domain-containing protein [Roseospirillum parvum]